MLRVAVAGGDLAVHQLGSGPQAVLALHGITSNGLAWAPVAAELAGVAAVLAPDLRGRACSAEVNDPAGLVVHADDALAVLDALGIERTVVVGHSMGGFVAALLAARHPERCTALVVVDGAIAFAPPAGTDLDAALDALVGPALQRLRRTFDTETAYLDFSARHPAFPALLAGPTADAVRAHLLHDLVPGPDGFRSSCVEPVVRSDGADMLGDRHIHDAIRAGTVATVLLRAERGLLDQPTGLITEADLTAARLPSAVDIRLIPEVNHYSILLGDVGARAAADAVQQVLLEP